MSETLYIEEKLSLELTTEDLAEVKNILTTEEPIESAKEVDANQLNKLIAATEGSSLTSGNLLTILPKYPNTSFSLIEGTPASDLLFDTAKNDYILARGGNDWIIAWRGGDDRIYGEEGNDFIFAGEGNDTAYGGSGNDRMYGSSGNDYMYGDSTYNYPYLFASTDSATPSLDTSKLSSVDSNSLIYPYLYPFYRHSKSGSDYMDGGSGNDYMYGGGGNDTMNGGLGDDTIVGNNRKYYPRYFLPYLDTQIVGSNDPIETTSVSTKNIDSLTGTLSSSTTIDDAVKSNSLTIAPEPIIKPPIYYHSDKDILTGGEGADKFVFYSAYSGVDKITDFNKSEGDQIRFSRYGGDLFLFSRYGGDSGLSYGEVEAEQFTLGTSATDANHRFIYDQSTGGLFFDADGDGIRAQVQFAKLFGNPELSHSDIFII